MSAVLGTSVSAQDDVNPALLTIIVDVDFSSWHERRENCRENCILYQELVSALVAFCNTYVLMHRQNRLCILASHPGQAGCTQIYPRRELGNSVSGADIVCDDFVPLGHLLPSILASGFLDSFLLNGIENGNVSDNDNAATGAGSSLSKALSKALCVTHRQVSSNPKLQPRLLLMQLRRDHPPCYNSIMNSIFSADRLNCPIDAIVLSPQNDSHFLQQACYLTRGTYQCPTDQRDLLQVLMTHCLASPSSREVLQGCVQKTVDFRATCYCHKTPVEFAYLCSVCLALSCEPRESCVVCGTVATVTQQ